MLARHRQLVDQSSGVADQNQNETADAHGQKHCYHEYHAYSGLHLPRTQHHGAEYEEISVHGARWQAHSIRPEHHCQLAVLVRRLRERQGDVCAQQQGHHWLNQLDQSHIQTTRQDPWATTRCSRSQGWSRHVPGLYWLCGWERARSGRNRCLHKQAQTV